MKDKKKGKEDRCKKMKQDFAAFREDILENDSDSGMFTLPNIISTSYTYINVDSPFTFGESDGSPKSYV